MEETMYRDAEPDPPETDGGGCACSCACSEGNETSTAAGNLAAAQEAKPDKP